MYKIVLAAYSVSTNVTDVNDDVRMWEDHEEAEKVAAHYRHLMNPDNTLLFTATVEPVTSLDHYTFPDEEEDDGE